MDMKSVIFIVGLPGSGKTTLAKKEYVPKGYKLLDDPKTMFDILNAMSCSKLVVVDPNLVFESNRKQAELMFSGWNMDWIFYQNDPEQAQKNLCNRNDGRNINLEIYTKAYGDTQQYAFPVYGR